MARVTIHQDTLFAGEPHVEASFLLTNRYNFLEMLAAQAAGPRESFDKYYEDLLSIAPGRLPFLSGPFTQSMIAHVMSEDPTTAFPVALEFDPKALINAAEADSLVGRATAPTGMLPLTELKAVHFRSQMELEEHAAREYENIRQPARLYRVSPTLFTGPDETSVLDWLRTLSPAPDDSLEIGRSDRSSGALAMMAALCPPADGAIETLRRVLDPHEVRGSKPHAAWIVAAIRGGKRGSSSIDGVLMGSALGVFRETDVTQAWRPVEILEAVWAAASPHIDESAREELERHLQRIREILRSERPFDRLRSGGVPSEKALLLALMRPDPARLAGVVPEEIGADWEVVLAAAALVGALRGRRRMPVELRALDLDQFLAAQESAAHNVRVKSTLSIPKLPGLRLTSRPVVGGRLVRLAAPPRVLLERNIADVSRATAITAADLLDPALVADIVALCIDLGWLDCLNLLVETSESAIEVTTKSQAGRITYQFPGDSATAQTLDPGRLLARLDRDLSPEGDDLRALIQSRQEPPDSQRYSN